jgi:hypothetical protein
MRWLGGEVSGLDYPGSSLIDCCQDMELRMEMTCHRYMYINIKTTVRVNLPEHMREGKYFKNSVYHMDNIRLL